MFKIFMFLMIAQASFSSCKRQEKFPELGNKLANPIDVATDKTGTYFFVLNTDYPRDFDAGSIITFSKEGERLAITPTKRLGRSLTVAGDDMLVTYSSEGEDVASRVELYDISNPAAPKFSASWNPDTCNPINAVARSGYKYFAVSCSNGSLLVGEFATPRSATQLRLVRRYPGARRAMHLDTTRNLLFAFPTDLGRADFSDQSLTDESSFAEDISSTETKVPNEIPDNWERTRNDRRNKARRGMYQFAVYDLAAESAKGYPRIDDYDSLASELRWTYFNLSNFDGFPDVAVTTSTLNTRYYRTNFWGAKPDVLDDDTFYLSHRGSTNADIGGNSPYANNILRVRITGDLRIVNGVTPKTEDVLTFERVYGFRGELEASGKHYPGDFQIERVNGAPLLVVNHFRDLINFPGQVYSSVASKVIGDNSWFSEIAESTTGHSYYQVALTPSGRAMALGFYQNVVILLDTAPGTAITEYKTIN